MKCERKWKSPTKSNKNILTLITCVKDKKNLRLCVQASEKV